MSNYLYPYLKRTVQIIEQHLDEVEPLELYSYMLSHDWQEWKIDTDYKHLSKFYQHANHSVRVPMNRNNADFRDDLINAIYSVCIIDDCYIESLLRLIKEEAKNELLLRLGKNLE